MKRVLAILCVLALIFSFAACSSKKEEEKSSYKDAIKVYQKVMNGDLDKLKDMAPEGVWDWYEEEYGESVDDLIAYMEESYADFQEELKEEYGDDAKVTISIADAEQCDEEMLEKITEVLNEEYEIKTSDVKDAYELTLTREIKGSEDSETSEMDVCVVQIQNDWYIIRYNEYDGETYIYFLAVS